MHSYLLLLLFSINFCHHWKEVGSAQFETQIRASKPYIEWCEEPHIRKRVSASKCKAYSFVYPYPACYCLDGIAFVTVDPENDRIREILFSKRGCFTHRTFGMRNRTIAVHPFEFSETDTVLGVQLVSTSGQNKSGDQISTDVVSDIVSQWTFFKQGQNEQSEDQSQPKPVTTGNSIVIYNGELFDTNQEYRNGSLYCVQRNTNPDLTKQVRHFKVQPNTWLLFNATCDGGNFIDDLEIISSGSLITRKNQRCNPQCPEHDKDSHAKSSARAIDPENGRVVVTDVVGETEETYCRPIPDQLKVLHKDLNDRILRHAIERSFHDSQNYKPDYKPAYSFKILQLLAKITTRYCKNADIPPSFLEQAIEYFKVAHEGRGFYFSEFFTEHDFSSISRLLRKCLFEMDSMPYFTSQGCDRKEVLAVYKSPLNPSAAKSIPPSFGHKNFDYHVVLDVPWNMLDLANTVCLKSFKKSYRMYHRMEHGLEKLFTYDLRTFWRYPYVPEYFYEHIFGPHWMTIARNLEKCVEAAYMNQPKMTRLIRPQWIPGQPQISYRSRGTTLVDPICRRRRNDLPIISNNFDIYCHITAPLKDGSDTGGQNSTGANLKVNETSSGEGSKEAVTELPQIPSIEEEKTSRFKGGSKTKSNTTIWLDIPPYTGHTQNISDFTTPPPETGHTTSPDLPQNSSMANDTSSDKSKGGDGSTTNTTIWLDIPPYNGLPQNSSVSTTPPPSTEDEQTSRFKGRKNTTHIRIDFPVNKGQPQPASGSTMPPSGTDKNTSNDEKDVIIGWQNSALNDTREIDHSQSSNISPDNPHSKPKTPNTGNQSKIGNETDIGWLPKPLIDEKDKNDTLPGKHNNSNLEPTGNDSRAQKNATTNLPIVVSTTNKPISGQTDLESDNVDYIKIDFPLETGAKSEKGITLTATPSSNSHSGKVPENVLLVRAKMEEMVKLVSMHASGMNKGGTNSGQLNDKYIKIDVPLGLETGQSPSAAGNREGESSTTETVTTPYFVEPKETSTTVQPPDVLPLIDLPNADNSSNSKDKIPENTNKNEAPPPKDKDVPLIEWPNADKSSSSKGKVPENTNKSEVPPPDDQDAPLIEFPTNYKPDSKQEVPDINGNKTKIPSKEENVVPVIDVPNNWSSNGSKIDPAAGFGSIISTEKPSQKAPVPEIVGENDNVHIDFILHNLKNSTIPGGVSNKTENKPQKGTTNTSTDENDSALLDFMDTEITTMGPASKIGLPSTTTPASQGPNIPKPEPFNNNTFQIKDFNDDDAIQDFNENNLKRGSRAGKFEVKVDPIEINRENSSLKSETVPLDQSNTLDWPVSIKFSSPTESSEDSVSIQDWLNIPEDNSSFILPPENYDTEATSDLAVGNEKSFISKVDFPVKSMSLIPEVAEEIENDSPLADANVLRRSNAFQDVDKTQGFDQHNALVVPRHLAADDYKAKKIIGPSELEIISWIQSYGIIPKSSTITETFRHPGFECSYTHILEPLQEDCTRFYACLQGNIISSHNQFSAYKEQVGPLLVMFKCHPTMYFDSRLQDCIFGSCPRM